MFTYKSSRQFDVAWLAVSVAQSVDCTTFDSRVMGFTLSSIISDENDLLYVALCFSNQNVGCGIGGADAKDCETLCNVKNLSWAGDVVIGSVFIICIGCN